MIFGYIRAIFLFCVFSLLIMNIVCCIASTFGRRSFHFAKRARFSILLPFDRFSKHSILLLLLDCSSLSILDAAVSESGSRLNFCPFLLSFSLASPLSPWFAAGAALILFWLNIALFAMQVMYRTSTLLSMCVCVCVCTIGLPDLYLFKWFANLFMPFISFTRITNLKPEKIPGMMYVYAIGYSMRSMPWLFTFLLAC